MYIEYRVMLLVCVKFIIIRFIISENKQLYETEESQGELDSHPTLAGIKLPLILTVIICSISVKC